MSNAEMIDEVDSIRQVSNPDPVHNKLTWLRHKADSEAGLIDQMVLEGNLTMEMMISKLQRIRGLTLKS